VVELTFDEKLERASNVIECMFRRAQKSGA